jgi:predicted RNase H-like nuclease (RuvC/YqgF family)
MTDDLVKRLLDFDKVTVGDARDAALRIEALTAKVKLMDDLDVINGEKIEALTEQLEAARADAKEAEAYAEGLEKEIELNEQEACMLENDFINADKEIDNLKAKLAKAVEALEAIRDRQYYRMGPGITAQVIARTTLAEIEAEKT